MTTSSLKPIFSPSFSLLILSICVLQGCQNKSKSSATSIPLPSSGCVSTWEQPHAKELVDMLEAATQSGLQVWEDYHLGDGAVVLHAGQSEQDSACLGVWLNGKVIGFKESRANPKLLTPLYGYHLNYEGLKAEDDYGLIKASTQPQEISSWLDELGVRSAVLMPTDFPDFPIKLSTLTKTQLAIHEAFHVEVQLRYWHTEKGPWPAWDVQPDRKGLQPCYHLSETVKTTVRKEQTLLADMIKALFANDKEQACQLGHEFLATRTERRQLVNEVSVQRKDGTACDCKEAETILEQEEGIADYASWTKLYELGLSSEEALLKRYNAIQNEPFYLMGAMQLHAISLMRNGQVNEIIRNIVSSKTPESGSLTALFKTQLEQYCGH